MNMINVTEMAGNIGRIFEADVKALLAAIAETINEMSVKIK